MCGQSKAGPAKPECRADRDGQRDGKHDDQSHSAVAYPAKQPLLQVPARFARQKHPSSPLLLTVNLSVAGLHPTLFATRQQVVEPEHIDVNDEQDKARPHDQQSETSQCKKQILRMPNAFVKTASYHPSPPEFGIVKLKSTQDEANQTEQENQPPDAWKNFRREMRQKERWQPCRSRKAERPGEQRAIDRVVVEGEGSDHEEHFQRDKQVR